MLNRIDKTLILLSLFLFVFVGGARQASAVMPPDFIFNIGSQLAQIFSIIFLFVSAFFSVMYRFVKIKFASLKLNKYYFIGIVILLIIFSFGLAYGYSSYKQKNEYEKWLQESQEYEEQFMKEGDNQSEVNDEEYKEAKLDLLSMGKNNEDIVRAVQEEEEHDSDKDGLSDKEEKQMYKTNPYLSDTDGDGYNDKTEIDGGYNPLVNQSSDNGGLGELDKNNEFIKRYYFNIASKNLREAYAMSKQSVSYDVFNGWYRNTTDIRMDKIIRIDEEKSSLELTLFEGDNYIQYGVLMTLRLEDGKPVQVGKSEVRTLGQGQVVIENNGEEKVIVISVDDEDIEEYNFYEENKQTRLSVGNEEFKNIIGVDKDEYIVLDAREDFEYENGNFPDSTHIRFADLRAGRWIEVPNDKIVYVLCWSGIRGKEVAEFLRTKKNRRFIS